MIKLARMSKLWTRENLGKATFCSVITSGLVVYENHSTPFQEYDQAIASRAVSTFVFTYIFFVVHNRIKKILPETFNRPASITATCTLASVTTYLVQLVCDDPEALEAAKWTLGLGLVGLSAVEYKEVIKKLLRKNN